MGILVSLFAGLVFGCGLLVSGMANPAKVLAFLDLAGAWDPSLMFVMGGAIAVGFLAFRLASKRSETLLGRSLCLPQPGAIDRRLLVGGTLFGIGWGLAGICPGPGLVLLGTGSLEGLVFVLAMLAGMGIYTRWPRACG